MAVPPSPRILFPKLTASQFDRVWVLLAVLVGMTSGASNEDTDKAFGVFCKAYVSFILAKTCISTQITVKSHLGVSLSRHAIMVNYQLAVWIGQRTEHSVYTDRYGER